MCCSYLGLRCIEADVWRVTAVVDSMHVQSSGPWHPQGWERKALGEAGARPAVLAVSEHGYPKFAAGGIVV